MKKDYHRVQGPSNITTSRIESIVNNLGNKKIMEVKERIHTRKLDRRVAKATMKKRGIVHVAKRHKTGSYFASNWREYSA